VKNGLVSLFLLFVPICFCLNEVNGNVRPNFIVILVDDMGYSDIGCMGSEIETPNLDSLAEDGLLFTNLYNTARCCPTRASLLTGLYSHAAGVGHMDSDKGYPSYQGFLGRDTVTIAEVLGNNGYRTILSGKWHLGGAREYWPDRRGFQRFYGIPKGGGLYFYPSRFIDREIYRNGVHVEPTDPDYYTTDAFTEEALLFIEESKNDDQPFFLYMAYVAPHYPLQAHEWDVEKYLGTYEVGYEAIRQARFEKQKAMGIVKANTELSPILDVDSSDDPKTMDRKMAVYAAQVDSLDQNVGKLVSGLKAMGLFENTAILFMSDNGAVSAEVDWELDGGPRGRIGTNESFVSYGKHWANVSNTPFRKYKAQTHEGGIASPLILHWPKGVRNEGRKTDSMIHVIDVMPTLLELAGVGYPETFSGNDIRAVHGKSFAKLIKGKALSEKRQYFWEHEGNCGVREGDLKAVKLHKGVWELYDMSIDPTELDDLADVRPETLSRLRRAYRHWTEVNGVKAWPVTVEKD
jgi:arylsulfatase A-like enzyme